MYACLSEFVKLRFTFVVSQLGRIGWSEDGRKTEEHDIIGWPLTYQQLEMFLSTTGIENSIMRLQFYNIHIGMDSSKN